MKVIAERHTVAKRGAHAVLAALSVHVIAILFGPPLSTGTGNRAEASGLIPPRPPMQGVAYRELRLERAIRPEITRPDADDVRWLEPVENPEAPELPELPGDDGRTLLGDGPILEPWQSGPSAPPAVLSRVEPIYPEMARRADVTGTVVVEVTIDRKGRVIDARVSSSDTVGVLETAALDAARRWTFRPARQGHRPVMCRAELVFTFRL